MSKVLIDGSHMPSICWKSKQEINTSLEKIEEQTALDSKKSSVMVDEVFDNAYNSVSSKSGKQVSFCTLSKIPF